MIKPRQIARAIRVEYSGAPSVTVFVDGSPLVENLLLPTNSFRKTRRILLPAGLVGHTFQVTFDSVPVQRFQLELDPVESFNTLSLFHYFEVTFEGTVKLEVYMDEVRKKANNREDQITLTTRDDRRQDTRRVYLPPLNWGYVPHLSQVDIANSTGQVHRSQPMILPSRFYKGLRDHSEVQITYQGFVKMEVYLDGEMVALLNLDAETNESEFLTVKRYLPAGSRGYALQWAQVENDGEIAVFESDTTLTDLQQPQQPVPA